MLAPQNEYGFRLVRRVQWESGLKGGEVSCAQGAATPAEATAGGKEKENDYRALHQTCFQLTRRTHESQSILCVRFTGLYKTLSRIYDLN